MGNLAFQNSVTSEKDDFAKFPAEQETRCSTTIGFELCSTDKISRSRRKEQKERKKYNAGIQQF